MTERGEINGREDHQGLDMKTQKFDLDLKLKMEEILEAKLEAMEDKMERKLARIEKKSLIKLKILKPDSVDE